MSEPAPAARPALGRHGPVLLAVAMALLAICSAQGGAALSRPTMDRFGPISTTGLRLCWAAMIVGAIARPPIHRYGRSQWIAALALGGAIALMSLCFYEAISRLPLSLVVAIEFMGPLSVGLAGLKHPSRLIWPIAALAGVLLLVHRDEGWWVDPAGLAFAGTSGLCWAAYILLSKRVGAAFQGLEGLAMSMATAALLVMPFGLAETGGLISGRQALETLGLALLSPIMTYPLEMMALRRMPAASFGVLMSTEPAVAALAGYLLLAQPLTPAQIAGTLLVVTASIGSVSSRSGTGGQA